MISSEKKGISAIISMVLLVSFVIVLGVVVTSWSGRLIQRNIEKSEERIGTDLECLNVNVKVTSGNNNVVFVQNNNLKEQKINGFISRFSVGNKIFVDYKNQDTIIAAFGAAKLDYSDVKDRNGVVEGGYNPAQLEKIEVIPKVVLEKGEVVDCAKKSAVYSL